MHSIYDYYITRDDYSRAAKYGVTMSLLTERIRRLAWDKERAITTPPAPRRPKIPQIVIDLADENGISYDLLYRRIFDKGWSLYDAATTPKKDSLSNLTHNHVRDPYADLAEKNGIKRSTYFDRVNRGGWDKIVAATTPPGERVRTNQGHIWRGYNKLLFTKKFTKQKSRC